jgi:K+-transporting ATPase KdpF subunit
VTVSETIGLVISLALVAYLVAALVFPERF